MNPIKAVGSVRLGFKKTHFVTKVKLRRVELLVKLHLSTTWCHLPYGITQCYLPADTSEHTLPLPQPDRLVCNLPTPEVWKAELTLSQDLGDWLHTEMVYQHTDGHQSEYMY